jgi:hypothetical protein
LLILLPKGFATSQDQHLSISLLKNSINQSGKFQSINWSIHQNPLSSRIIHYHYNYNSFKVHVFFLLLLSSSTTVYYYFLLLPAAWPFHSSQICTHKTNNTSSPHALSCIWVRCSSDAHLIIIIIISSHHSFKRAFDFTTGIQRDPKTGLMD